ncbi:hypothetical protein [Pseudomonas indica]|uniref:primase 1D-like protein n=1 Tax=Pseudomonas indica TaxID=137658 RepID=UPI003C6E958B
MTKEKIEEIINSLGEFEELALNSKVRASRKVHHIPMIDFFTDIETLNKNKQTLKNILPSKIYKNLEIYSSGNSLHGYSLTLISPKEWLDYMGRLLLTNLPNKPQLVDTRWIGHRLRAGYTSLRWSNNSKNYLASPTLIGHLDLLN